LKAEYNGRDIEENAKEYTWDFRGDQYTINHNNNFAELWHVGLNSGKKPKLIDGKHDLTGHKMMGIYELDGDSLKVCYDMTGFGRPDSFKTTPGSRRVCYYFERK